MKLLVVLLVGLVLGGVGIAGAASLWRANGILCRPMAGGIACLRSDGAGYGVGITRDFVMVMNMDTGRRVFVRYQP